MLTTATAAAGGESSGREREAHCLRLPGTLLAQVLGHVSQGERLQHAAPVCSAFATAAAAATASVDIVSLQIKHTTAFQAWLDRHAQQLVSLSVKTMNLESRSLGALPLRLPAAAVLQLRSLDLKCVELLLPERAEKPDLAGSSSGGTASTSTSTEVLLPERAQAGSGSTSTNTSEPTVALLPKLRDLQLDSCVLRVEAVRQLGQPSGLTRLQLRSLSPQHIMVQEMLRCGSEVGCLQMQLVTAVRQILQRSPQVARLELACWNQPYVTTTGMLSDFAAHFPSSLTALRLGDVGSVYGGMGAPDLACCVSALTNLRELAACKVGVCITALASLTQLRDLQLHHFSFLLPQPDNPAGAADGAAASALLSALLGMLQLQRLSVVSEQNELAGAQASAFAALTASSQLTYLQVSAVEEQPLPPAALQHMFPAGKQLPLLQHVTLSCDGLDAEAGHATAAELRLLFSACRGLSSLDITDLLEPDTDIQVLLELPTTCCSLRVGGDRLDDDAAAVIAKLTHLTCLHWNNSPELTDAGLEYLIDLEALESFCMCGNHGLSDGVVVKEDGLHLTMFELIAGAKPVSQQLHELLESVAGA